MTKLTLVFDGGSRGNPGPAYGSYRIQVDDTSPQRPRRLNFGETTNNRAEYESLIAGVEGALELLKDRGIEAHSVSLEIRGDSQLVIYQVQGSWKTKDPQLQRYRDQLLKLFENFRRVELIHHERARTVEILHH